MLKCWQHYPEGRPEFPELQNDLDIMLTSQQKEEYIEISNVDDPYCQMYPAQEDDPVDNSIIQVSIILILYSTISLKILKIAN